LADFREKEAKSLKIQDDKRQGRNQLILSGGENDVACCCTEQIHLFLKISGGGQLPPLVAGLTSMTVSSCF